MRDALETVAIVSSICRGYLAFIRAGGVETNLHFVSQNINLAALFLFLELASPDSDAVRVGCLLDLHIEMLASILGIESLVVRRLEELRCRPIDALVDLDKYKRAPAWFLEEMQL